MLHSWATTLTNYNSVNRKTDDPPILTPEAAGRRHFGSGGGEISRRARFGFGWRLR